MVEGGEDPAFIARRLVISASEDIGLANPNACLLYTSRDALAHTNDREQCQADTVEYEECIVQMDEMLTEEDDPQQGQSGTNPVSYTHLAALEAGCNDFLTKPFTQEVLKETIKKWLDDKG